MHIFVYMLRCADGWAKRAERRRALRHAPFGARSGRGELKVHSCREHSRQQRSILPRPERALRRVQNAVLAGVSNSDIEAAVRVLRHNCGAVAASQESDA
jgi:hypothetical protein